MNILITSAGRRVSLIKAFKAEIENLKLESKVFTCDLDPEMSSACRVSDGFFKINKVTESTYIENLTKLCKENNIKIVIPTIDTELSVLAENKDFLEQNGIIPIISNLEWVTIFRDKRKTHVFFESIGLKVAKEYKKDNYTLPMYIKPYDGSRSINNYIILKKEELKPIHFENDKLMFLEYLDHNNFTEYTIDLYYDKKSSLKCLIPRKRIAVREGEVNKAITKKDFFYDYLWQQFKNINGFKGCITLQVFVNHNTKEIYGIEINLRFGGGYPLSYFAGGNFPNWILKEYILNQNIEILNTWENNLLMLRYDSEVLVHNHED